MPPAPFEMLTPADLRARASIKWQHYGPDVLPLWVADMDVLPAPEVVEALTSAVRAGDTGYPGSGRTYAEAFAEFAAHRWGWEVRPADTIVCADVMTGIRALVEHLLPHRGRVVIPSPVYPPFATFSRELGREVVQVPLTESGRLDVRAIDEALAGHRPTPAHSGSPRSGPQAPPPARPDRVGASGAGAGAVLLLCSPHNPTGVVHSRAELLAVAEAAERHGAAVVVDEVHGPLVTRGATFVPWLEVSEAGFAVTSAAKSFNLAGLKAGLILAGRASRSTLRRLPESLPYGASHLGVVGHAAAYRSDPVWLDAVNRNIAANADALAELLARALPTIGYRPPEATYLAWLDCRTLGLGDDPAAAFLARGRVALTPGPPFGPGGAGHARINVACSRAVLTEAVERMARTVRPAG